MEKLKQRGPRDTHTVMGQLLEAAIYSKRNNDCPESETISEVIKWSMKTSGNAYEILQTKNLHETVRHHNKYTVQWSNTTYIHVTKLWIENINKNIIYTKITLP